MHRLTLLVLAAVALGTLSGAQGQDRPDLQLKAAVYKETVEGDLQGAITLYRQLVSNAAVPRQVVAAALLGLGGCYEKLGQQDARKVYERLVAEYADQPQEVATARRRLAALKTTLREASSLPSLRLVWEGPEVELMGAPSPDGRYISYTDWDTGDLAIHDLTTGENRRLSGQKAWDGSFAERSRWSPDGRLIAFTWATVGDTADLRLVGLDGARPRILFQGSRFPWATVEDWSPDGRQILARLYTDSPGRTSVLSLISTSDGSVRHLKNMSQRAMGYGSYVKFSPDGRYIAFDYQNQDTAGGITAPADTDIHLVSANGENEIALVEHPANDYLLGWTPDGSSVLFASDRTGAVDAWLLPMEGGQPGGEAQVLRKDIGGISPLGFARDGTFFYGHGRDLRNIYVATIDRTPRSMTATYRKLALPFEGRNDTAEFSPDGKRLAFVRASSPRATGPAGQWHNSLCVFSLETAEERCFPLNLQPGWLRWSPDGASILVGGFAEMKAFVGTVNTQTGARTRIFSSDADFREELYLSPDWSPDGRSVYCAACRLTDAEPTCSIIAKEFETGQTRVIYKVSQLAPVISVSPDGKWLAVYGHPVTGGKGGPTERTLQVVSTEDGAARELCRFVNGTNGMVSPRWSVDGRYVLFPGIRPGEEGWDVWYVPVEGGSPARLGLSVRGLDEISPHPDGVRIAFSSLGPTVHGPAVWVMENFLPVAKGTAAAQKRKE